MKMKLNIFIIIAVVLMFIADGANRVLIFLDAPFQRVSILVRLVVQVFFLFLLLRKRQGLKTWGLVFFFYAIFLLGSLAAADRYVAYDWLENFTMVNKALFFFICWETFKRYFPTAESRSSLFKVFEILIGVEVLSIFVGFLFNLEVFASYEGFVRFGYKGLIPAQNEVSGFFVIAFFYTLHKTKRDNRGTLRLIATLLAALLTGTKVTLLFPVILLLYMVRELAKIRVNRIFIYLAAAIFVFMVVAAIQIDYVLTRIAPTLSYYSYRLKQGYSYFDLLASGRNFLSETFFSQFFPRFNLVNYLFGGHDLTALSTETDPVDVFARFGLIGSVIFYGLYVRILYHKKELDFTHLLFVFTWLGVSTVAGHLVFSAINGVYLAILLLTFHSREFSVVRKTPDFATEISPDYRGFMQTL